MTTFIKEFKDLELKEQKQVVNILAILGFFEVALWITITSTSSFIVPIDGQVLLTVLYAIASIHLDGLLGSSIIHIKKLI